MHFWLHPCTSIHKLSQHLILQHAKLFLIIQCLCVLSLVTPYNIAKTRFHFPAGFVDCARKRVYSTSQITDDQMKVSNANEIWGLDQIESLLYRYDSCETVQPKV